MLAAPIGFALGVRAGATDALASPVGVSLATAARSAQVVSVETILGDQTGPGCFKEPQGLMLGPDGILYVVEGGNHRLQRLGVDGKHLGFISGPGDGPGQLREPTALAFDADGTLLVTDTGHARVVRLAPDGAEIASWTASGGPSGKLVTPYGITVSRFGTVYVSDPETRRVERFSREGVGGGGWPTLDPSVSLAMDPNGMLWSAEREAIGGVKTTFRARLRRYSATGDLQTSIEKVTWPEMLALAPDNTLIVSDNGHFLDNPFAARRFSQNGDEIATYGGLGPGRPPGGFGWAHGIAVLPDGRVVVADSRYDCLQVFAPTAESLGVWGVPKLVPIAMQMDGSGSLTVVGDNDPRVHRVAPDGTYAVIGVPPEYRPTQQLGAIQATVGPDRRAYVVAENTGELRRYAPDGSVEAELRLTALNVGAGRPIDSIAVDGAGRLFVSSSNSGRIQRLSPEGVVETEWTAVGGTPRPNVLAVSPNRSLYVADAFAGRVDRYSLDGEHLGAVIGPEVDGRRPRIAAMAAGPDDRLVVADEGEKRLILVGADGTVQTCSASSLGLGEKASLGAVAFDPSGAALVTVKDEARVLRVRLG